MGTGMLSFSALSLSLLGLIIFIVAEKTGRGRYWPLFVLLQMAALSIAVFLI